MEAGSQYLSNCESDITNYWDGKHKGSKLSVQWRMLRQKKEINSPSLHMLSLRSLYGRSCKDERACSNLGEDFRLERPEKKAKIKSVKSCKEERVSIESALECHLMSSGWEQHSCQEPWLFLCRFVLVWSAISVSSGLSDVESRQQFQRQYMGLMSSSKPFPTFSLYTFSTLLFWTLQILDFWW